MTTHGLGYLPSPPDERDWQLADLLTADQLLAAPPATYRVPHLPSTVYDQGDSPMCVAYSSATEQAAFDLADLGHTYKWDFPWFFRQIHGTANGAILRDALQQRLAKGYPLQPYASNNSRAAHRITAYYRVAQTKLALQQALMAYGVVVIGTPWYDSWFDPDANGVLPIGDFVAGGHAICVVGWNSTGPRLRNTWGADWGQNGEATMRWSQYVSVVREAWKCIDDKTGA